MFIIAAIGLNGRQCGGAQIDHWFDQRSRVTVGESGQTGEFDEDYVGVDLVDLLKMRLRILTWTKGRAIIDATKNTNLAGEQACQRGSICFVSFGGLIPRNE